MALRPYIPIDVENLPEMFEFDFGSVTYKIQVSYNTVIEAFTLDILTAMSEPIIMGEVLVLNEKLWNESSDARLPFEDIIPMDESGEETMITKDNFGKTVFLYIDQLSPDEVDQTNGVLNG